MVNEALMAAIQGEGMLDDGEMVTEAIVIYAAVGSDMGADQVRYGQFYLNETMPVHHALGLLQVSMDRLNSVEVEDE